jgi:hypothetical protein
VPEGVNKRNRHEKKVEAYLHDELNGTDEVREELENQVLLLLLHLVETELAAASLNLRLGETDAGVSLEHVLGDSAATTGGGSLLLLLFELVSILGLEVVNEGINVLILIVIVDRGRLGGGSTSGRGVLLGALLVEAAGLDVGVQRRSARDLLLVHLVGVLVSLGAEKKLLKVNRCRR